MDPFGPIIWQGDALSVLRRMASESINCCVTSPPYFNQRDYNGDPDQLGAEHTPDEYVARLVAVFNELRRVLRSDGTFWLNLGDSYAGGGNGARDASRWPKQSRNDHRTVHAKKKTGLPHKALIGIPWMVAFALRNAGWFLRQEIIWSKPNAMPESVKDRCTCAHETIFIFSKNGHYFYDSAAIEEPAIWQPEGKGKNHHSVKQGGFNDKGPIPSWGHQSFRSIRETRNKRSVWTVSTGNYRKAHFATYPPKLIEPCILAGCPRGGVVIDPFAGAGTTALVAKMHGRASISIELTAHNCELIKERLWV